MFHQTGMASETKIEKRSVRHANWQVKLKLKREGTSGEITSDLVPLGIFEEPEVLNRFDKWSKQHFAFLVFEERERGQLQQIILILAAGTSSQRRSEVLRELTH